MDADNGKINFAAILGKHPAFADSETPLVEWYRHMEKANTVRHRRLKPS